MLFVGDVLAESACCPGARRYCKFGGGTKCCCCCDGIALGTFEVVRHSACFLWKFSPLDDVGKFVLLLLVLSGTLSDFP